MCQAIHGADASIDFNVDGRVDLDDLRLFVRSGLNTHIGDANLDGQFDSTDLVAVFQAGEYDDAIAENSTWVDGDWNCDAEFTSRDFVFAFQDGSYVRAVRTNRNDAALSPAAWIDAFGIEHSIATHQDREVTANSIDWSRSRERLVDLVLSNRGHDPTLSSIFAEPPNIEHADVISDMDAFEWIGVDEI